MLDQAPNKFRREINAIAPHDRIRLDLEIPEQIQARKLPNNWPMVALDNALKISNTTTPVIKHNGYLVVTNVFRINYVKHINISNVDNSFFLSNHNPLGHQENRKFDFDVMKKMAA